MGKCRNQALMAVNGLHLLPADTSRLRREIRRDLLRQRDALAAEQRQQKSAAIHRRILADSAVVKAKTIFTYINFRSEVETLPLVKVWLAAGKTVCVPLTLAEDSRLAPYRISDPDRDLAPGYCQIPEPDPATAIPIDPATIEVIVLPGSAFDLHGGRLGYGGGFYDRFITDQAPHALRVGVAFDLQVTAQLPLLPHDQRLHALITESRAINFSRPANLLLP